MLIQDCRSLFLDQSFTLCHVKRQANATVDALAKAASSFASQSFWRDAPPLLGAILASDVSIYSH